MPRGFAALSDERKREIASKGGKAAHAQGRAHEFTKEEAREAGRRGGASVARDREHMAALGRAGGIARAEQRRARAAAEETVDGTPNEA